MNSELNKQAQTLEITFSRKTKSHHSQTCSNNILRIYLNEKLNFYHHIIEINAQIHIYFFSIRAFFHRHWQLTGQQGKGGDHLLFHSTTSTRSQAFRHLLFATLHVRWLSHIFNGTACIYQVATRWDLPRYRITIWLTDDVTLSFFCLRDDLILDFLFYSNLGWETGGFRLASTITLVLQANQLTKCASHTNEYKIRKSVLLD